MNLIRFKKINKMKTKIPFIIVKCSFHLLSCTFLFGQTTFNYTGAAQTYTVPTCADFIIVDVKGAEGAAAIPGAYVASPGGKGGRVQATIRVTPGEVLNIYVGQKALLANGGWNGGGPGGANAGGGGGASDIRRYGQTLSNRIIIAGAGGGGGYNTNDSSLSGYAGGNGGGTAGAKGWYLDDTQASSYGGKGGTATTGGAGGGGSSYRGNPGTIGAGGSGATYYGGGGAAGYYGGGGGGALLSGGGGGGGSSYTISTATSVIHTQGFQTGDGQIIITPLFSTGPAAPGAISGNSSVCEGTLQTYSVSTVAGAASYIWTLPSGWSGSSTTNSINATVSAAGGNIKVKAVNSCGTSDTSTMTITVITALVGDAGPDTSICTGGAVTLNASGGSDYSWNPPTGLSCTSCPNPVANPTATTDYTVTVSSGSCISDSDTIQVTVNPLPTANAGANVTICSGDSVQLNASGGISYSWIPNIGLSDPNIANPIANPNTTTTYIVNVTDVNDCMNKDSVVVNTINTLVADAGADTSICEGDAVALNASGGSSYSWSPSAGLSCTNCPNPIASPSVTTNYEVIISSGTCPADSDTVLVTVNSPNADAGPDVTICSGNSTTLNASGGISYSWSPTTGLSDPDIADPEAYPTTTTAYVVDVSDAQGCVATATVTVTVEICAGISSISRSKEILVFPNPANEVLNIQTNNIELKELTFWIMNMKGQVVCNNKIGRISGNYNQQIDISSFPEGIYYIKIIMDEESSILKLILH